MATEFKFPDVGEGIQEGEVRKWYVKVGDVVQEHQTIVEVETDKAVVAIPSPKAGTILKIHFSEGQTIKVGETLATIGEKNETVPSTPSPSQTQVTQAAKPKVPQKGVSVIGELEEAPEEEAEAPREILATPAVRRIAREKGIDLAKVKGTGPHGRILEEDLNQPSKPTAAPAPSPKAASITPARQVERATGTDSDRIPLKGVRKTIATRVSQSVHTAAHATSMDEIDVTHLWEMREHEEKIAKEKGIKLTFLPFIIKACVAALKAHPIVNSTIDAEKEEIVLKRYYNIGIAVDTEEGLIVPVVKDADKKGILDIAHEIVTLAEDTRKRTVNLQDLQGGTFTITNYGSLGGLFATPVINFPEVAILGTGRIFDKPVVRDGQVVIRKILPVSFSFDHRVFDGAEAVRFVNEVKKYLEDPDLLLVA